MSDHLPECDDNWIQDKRAEYPYCICPALRAYEARVREEAYDEGYKDAEKYYTNSCFLCGYAGEWSTWICDECQERMNQEAEEWEDE